MFSFSFPAPARWGRKFVAALLLLIPIAFVLLWRAGAWLVVEDPLEKADAIFVLGGTRVERPLEAFDLYTEGWAPRILLLQIVRDFGEVELMRRGFPFPLESDVQKDVLVRLGVPEADIMMLGEGDSTKDEVRSIRAAVVKYGWKKIIIVTSKQHTRRARLVAGRQLRDTGVQLIMRASRYDRSDAEHWWRARSTIRFTVFETQRLMLYWIGVAD